MKIKRLIVPLITFLVGLTVGVGIMAAMVKKGPNQVIAEMSLGWTSETALYGTLLFEKKYDDLQRIIENSFLTSLNFQKGLNLSPDAYHRSQKDVRGYFDLTGRPVSPLIEEHLKSVPAGSGTDMRHYAEMILRLEDTRTIGPR